MVRFREEKKPKFRIGGDTEKMNITFLIGNGFDLNLGLKTTFEDFLNIIVAKKIVKTITTKLQNSKKL